MKLEAIMRIDHDRKVYMAGDPLTVKKADGERLIKLGAAREIVKTAALDDSTEDNNDEDKTE